MNLDEHLVGLRLRYRALFERERRETVASRGLGERVKLVCVAHCGCLQVGDVENEPICATAMVDLYTLKVPEDYSRHVGSCVDHCTTLARASRPSFHCVVVWHNIGRRCVLSIRHARNFFCDYFALPLWRTSGQMREADRNTGDTDLSRFWKDGRFAFPSVNIGSCQEKVSIGPDGQGC